MENGKYNLAQALSSANKWSRVQLIPPPPQKKKGQKEEKKKSIEVIFHHTIAILLCPIMRKVAVQTKKAIYIYKQHNFIKNNKIKRNPSSWVYTKE